MIMQSTQSQQAGVGLRCMQTGLKSCIYLVRTYFIPALTQIMLPLPSVQLARKFTISIDLFNIALDR